jgi:hypothetical protein
VVYLFVTSLPTFPHIFALVLSGATAVRRNARQPTRPRWVQLCRYLLGFTRLFLVDEHHWVHNALAVDGGDDEEWSATILEETHELHLRLPIALSIKAYVKGRVVRKR